MPKRAVRILCVTIMLGLPLAAEGADQSHADNKSTAPQSSPQQPQSQTQQSAQPAKAGALSRDVCDKHPNLKQCS